MAVIDTEFPDGNMGAVLTAVLGGILTAGSLQGVNRRIGVYIFGINGTKQYFHNGMMVKCSLFMLELLYNEIRGVFNGVSRSFRRAGKSGG